MCVPSSQDSLWEKGIPCYLLAGLTFCFSVHFTPLVWSVSSRLATGQTSMCLEVWKKQRRPRERLPCNRNKPFCNISKRRCMVFMCIIKIKSNACVAWCDLGSILICTQLQLILSTPSHPIKQETAVQWNSWHDHMDRLPLEVPLWLLNRECHCVCKVHSTCARQVGQQGGILLFKSMSEQTCGGAHHMLNLCSVPAML